MKKILFLALSFLVLIQCSQAADQSIDQEIGTSEDVSVNFNYQGLGKSSEEFVSNWNQLVNTISEDESTILYFSMNPNNVKWTSETKEALYYSFGDSGDESNINNVFVINMYNFSSLTIFLIVSFIVSLYFLFKVTSKTIN